MTHFRHGYRKPYAGRVLDGPHEGDWVEQDDPFFQAYYQRPLAGVFAYSADPPSAVAEVDRALYRWLHGYRAWAWVQPSAHKGKSNVY
jgi:hypothetical protein